MLDVLVLRVIIKCRGLFIIIVLNFLFSLGMGTVAVSSVICDKTFSTCASGKKWKKVGKSGKLAYFGKCDKIGVLHRKVEFG